MTRVTISLTYNCSNTGVKRTDLSTFAWFFCKYNGLRWIGSKSKVNKMGRLVLNVVVEGWRPELLNDLRTAVRKRFGNCVFVFVRRHRKKNVDGR